MHSDPEQPQSPTYSNALMWRPAYKPHSAIELNTQPCLIIEHRLWPCPGRIQTVPWPITEYSLQPHPTRDFRQQPHPITEHSLWPHPTVGFRWKSHVTRKPDQQSSPTAKRSQIAKPRLRLCQLWSLVCNLTWSQNIACSLRPHPTVRLAQWSCLNTESKQQHSQWGSTA